MALILAIEPDRRQAGQLTALVKGRLHAEVVIGDSAETALAALGSRVPDLVLTTALLSPKDESALSERLRALDGAAAHVQTLTIPVLATTSRRRIGGKAGGVLSALLGDKSKTDDSAAPEGCDPAMFAEQCKEYLERAAAERASTIEKQHALVEEGLEPLPALVFQAAPTYESAPAYESAPIYEPAPTYEAAPIYQPTFEAAPVYESAPAETESQESGAQAESAYLDTFAQQAGAAVEPEAPAATAPIAMPQASEHRVFMPRVNDDEPPAALLAAVAAFADVDEQAMYADSPTETFRTTEITEITETQPAESDAAVAVESASDEQPSVTNDLADVDLSSFFDDRLRHADAVDEPSVPVYELDTSSFDGHSGSDALFVEAADSDDVMLSSEPVYTAAVKPEVRTWPILEEIATTDPADSTDGSALSAFSAAPAPASFARTEADEMREWSDIIEALRRDAHPTITPVQEPVVSAPDPIVESIIPAAIAPEPIDAAWGEPSAAQPVVAAPAPAESVIAEPVVVQERVAVETAAPEAVTSDAAASDPAPADPVAKRRKSRRKGSVEDEWGFFDPDRAGFAALLAKLEEITEDDSAKPQRT